MPLSIPSTLPSVREANISASSTIGTTVTANASANTKGNYSSLVDPTTNPSYGIWVLFRNVQVSAAVQNVLVDIAYGPTGGGNELIIIPDLNAGNAAADATVVGGKLYYFPIYIPSGVRVSARCQASTGGDTVVVTIWLDQMPMYPFVAGLVSVYGRDATNSRGTSVTPGAGAFGTWTELLNAAGGSGVTRPHRFWLMGMDMLADITGTDSHYLVAELGIGPNSGAVTKIAGPFQFQEEGTEPFAGPFPPTPQLGVVTVDATNDKLWARLSKTASAEARGVMAWGID